MDLYNPPIALIFEVMLMVKKKSPSWEEIGSAIGKKIEKEKHNIPWKYHWKHEAKEHGSGFVGRLLLIIGLIGAFHALGWMAAVPVWTQVLIVIGFTLLRF
jgi:hypothetical protein